MELENLLPLLFAAIWIISRFLKAKPKKDIPKKPVRPQQASRPNQASPPPQRKKAFSFEDILKEFEKNLAGEEDVEERPMSVEEIQYEKPKAVPFETKVKPSPYQSYEGIGQEALEISKSVEKEDEFMQSEKYKTNVSEGNDFAEMLRDPRGAKNAIVLSEIINRKYF